MTSEVRKIKQGRGTGNVQMADRGWESRRSGEMTFLWRPKLVSKQPSGELGKGRCGHEEEQA